MKTHGDRRGARGVHFASVRESNHEPPRPRRRSAPFGASLVLMLFCHAARAQELEPRAYSPSPVGTNFVVVTYGRQTGDVFVDPTLPIDDVAVTLNAASLLYGRTFDLAGRQAVVAVALPYVWGGVKGTVFEQQQEITRSGLGDLRLKLSTNLLGGPALEPREFAARKPATTLGASLTVVAPTGQYDKAKLINLGSNRWAFKPEVGVSHPIGRWTVEAVGGVWLFKHNGDFFGGSLLTQKPLGSFQGHVSYTIRRGLWLAGGATYYVGGRTSVNGVEKNTEQKNARAGLSCSIPLGRGQSVKLNWARGVTTRVGGNLNALAVSWQYVWF
jgi:hypothetical protein